MPRVRLGFSAAAALTACAALRDPDRPGSSRLQPRCRRPRAGHRTAAHDGQRDAHRGAPRRRGHRADRPARPRRPRAGRLPVAQPWRGRPEHHRHRAVRRARRHPHRRAAAGAHARRRRPVLHPRLRLRLHQDPGGSVGEVGRRGHRRRHGPRHPPLPAARRPERLERDARRRARPAPAGREARAAGLRRGRRSGEVSRADRRGPAAVAGEEALRAARLRRRRRRRRRCGCRPGRSIRCSAAAYFEIAMEGRSQHKSQEMGVIEGRGARTSNLRSDHEPDAGRQRVLDARDRRDAACSPASTRPSIGLAALAGLPKGALATELAAMDAAAAEALASADIVRAPAKLVPVLARGLAAARAARTAAAALSATADAKAEADFLLALKVAEFEDALVRASGIVVDALADREVASAGDTLEGERQRVPAGRDARHGRRRARSSSPPDGPRRRRRRQADAAGGSPFARLFREQPTRTEPWQVHGRGRCAADAAGTGCARRAPARCSPGPACRRRCRRCRSSRRPSSRAFR